MSLAERISPLIGRIVLGLFFLFPAWEKVQDFQHYSDLVAAKGIVAAPFFLAAAAAVEAIWGFALLIGYRTQVAALFLFTYTLLVSAIMHKFWRETDPTIFSYERMLFFKNMAIAGGLLMIVGLGPGTVAVDNRIKD